MTLAAANSPWQSERDLVDGRYGRGRWRKRKGYAELRFTDGKIARAELHCYEATGIGRREFKIKCFL